MMTMVSNPSTQHDDELHHHDDQHEQQLVNEISNTLILNGIYYCHCKSIPDIINDNNNVSNSTTTTTTDSTTGNNNDGQYWKDYLNSIQQSDSDEHCMIVQEIVRRYQPCCSCTLRHFSSVSLSLPLAERILHSSCIKAQELWDCPDTDERKEYYRNIFYNQYINTQGIESGKPNATSNSTTNGPSFSLFHNNTNINSFISWDIILDRTNSDTTHAIEMLLNDVTYIEDIIPDLDDVCTVLRKELVQSIISPNIANNDSNNDNATLGQRILQLYRKWFHQTQKDAVQNQHGDDRTMQIQLLYTILQTIQQVQQEQEKTFEIDGIEYAKNNDDNDHTNYASGSGIKNPIDIVLFKECIILLFDTITFWMNHNIYSHFDTTMKEIGITIWNWSTSITKTTTSSSKTTMIIHNFCMQYTDWIYQWFTQRYVSINKMIDFLSEPILASTSIIPNAEHLHEQAASSATATINKLQHLHNIAMDISTTSLFKSSLLPISADSGTTTSPSTATIMHQYIWIVSMVHSILVTTRVSHFPWHLLKPISTITILNSDNYQPDTIQTDDNDDFHKKQQVLVQIYQLFYQLLNWSIGNVIQIEKCSVTVSASNAASKFDVGAVCAMCISSIEILICGCNTHPYYSNIQRTMTTDIRELLASTKSMCNSTTTTINADVSVSDIGYMIQQMIDRLHFSNCGRCFIDTLENKMGF